MEKGRGMGGRVGSFRVGGGDGAGLREESGHWGVDVGAGVGRECW